MRIASALNERASDLFQECHLGKDAGFLRRQLLFFLQGFLQQLISPNLVLSHLVLRQPQRFVGLCLLSSLLLRNRPPPPSSLSVALLASYLPCLPSQFLRVGACVYGVWKEAGDYRGQVASRQEPVAPHIADGSS